MLKGRGKFVFEDMDMIVNTGMYTDFSSGDYTFSNAGEECFVAFFTWERSF